MKNKNLRHPKNLKIIEEFEMDVPAILKQDIEPASPMVEEVNTPVSLRSFSLEEESFSGL